LTFDRKKWWKIHYAENSEYYKSKVKQYARVNVMKVLELKSRYKCKCGESNPLFLDFHHRNGDDKFMNVGQMRLFSWKRVIKEIEKCDIMCMKCHRLQHTDPELIDYVNKLITDK